MSGRPKNRSTGDSAEVAALFSEIPNSDNLSVVNISGAQTQFHRKLAAATQVPLQAAGHPGADLERRVVAAGCGSREGRDA